MLSLQNAKDMFFAVMEAAIASRPQEVACRGQPAMAGVLREQIMAAGRQKEGHPM